MHLVGHGDGVFGIPGVWGHLLCWVLILWLGWLQVMALQMVA